MYSTLPLALLCALVLPSSSPVAALPAPLDLLALNGWRTLPAGMGMYNATEQPASQQQHHHVAPPPPPSESAKVLEARARNVIKNPKVVKNPKNPYFSSSLAPEPTTATTSTAEPSSSSSSEPTSTSETTSAAQPSSTGHVYTGGFATYYWQNGNPGNCGAYMQDSDLIVALPTRTYDNGAHCWKNVRVTRVSDGASVVAMVADSCPSCVNDASIDMSYAAFTKIATEEEGMVAVTWEFI